MQKKHSHYARQPPLKQMSLQQLPEAVDTVSDMQYGIQNIIVTLAISVGWTSTTTTAVISASTRTLQPPIS